MTNGPGDNVELLLDPKSGVDVAFMQGGFADVPGADRLMMLATLYYVPMWIFYNGPDTLNLVADLRYRRIAIGVKGSGARSFAEPVLAINGLNDGNTTLLPMNNIAALRALQSGDIGAAIFVDAPQNEAVWEALHDPDLKLLSYGHADAYQRRFSYITKLTVPPGMVEFAQNIPAKEIVLIGTKEMLVARDGLHPALVDLFVDAAQEIHGEQGFFRQAGEFPGTTLVDLRVSPEADRHKHFGPRFLYQYLPFPGGSDSRAVHHHIAPACRDSLPIVPLSASDPALAGPITCLSLVRGAGIARARCSNANGHVAIEGVAR